MATQIQLRRGTGIQHGSFTGADGEVTVNTTNKSLHVHDGTTAGGFEAARADLSNASNVGVLTATTFDGNLTGTATTTTNIPNLSGDITSANTVTTLATVNSNVGTFGNGSNIPTITVNAKGLVTAVSTTAVDPANDGTLTLATSGTGLSGSATFTANDTDNVTFTVTSNATNENTGSTIVARDASGNFIAGIITATSFSGSLTGNVTGSVTGNVTGNADTASSLASARTIALSGDVSGSTTFDGSANVTITATVADDSHNHIISNVDGLQTALDAKAPLESPALTGTPTAPTAAAGTNTTQVATTAFVSTAVSNLVDTAPTTLDTLNELAAALNDDPNFATTVTNSIATKLPLSGGEMTGNITFSGAQTVDGRDLSVDGAKLDGIESGATADQTASEILTAIKTVDGASSGLDADLLDGQEGSYYRIDVYNSSGTLLN